MSRGICTVILCFGLVLSASSLQGSQASDRRAPAQRVAAASDAKEVFTYLLKGMVPPGPSSKLVGLLMENDESLWEELESDHIRSLEASFDTESLEELAEFFESSTGRAWNSALPELVRIQYTRSTADQRAPEPSVEEGSPLARLVKIFELEGESTAYLSRSFRKRQLKKLADFFEGSLGQRWLKTSEEFQEKMLKDLGAGSIMHRFAVLGCVVAVAAPNLNAALESGGIEEAEMTADSLRPLLGFLAPIESLCSCGLGKLVEQLGPEAFVKLQNGEEEAAVAFRGIIESGDCIPSELRASATNAVAKRVVAEIREIGIAMMMWLTDRISSADPDYQSPIPGSEEGWLMTPREGGAPVFFSRVSAHDLERLLVPEYLAELTRTDPWGNEYEFAISDDLLAEHTLSIRSPGKDGVFEEGAYESGGFSVEGSGLDADFLWADGYFVRWPEIGGVRLP